MTEIEKKNKRGGRRPGAGRPKTSDPGKMFSFRADGGMTRFLEQKTDRGSFIRNCIQKEMSPAAALSSLGDVFPATNVRDMNIPLFDIEIVAGFPIPLDNDERAQDIELLKMLCPHPEASYLIRVKGDSMIDADIHSGDIVIVDKSERNPARDQVAVCEFNGEYTLKYFEKRGDCGYLIPANPNYPEIKITPDDQFCVWGVVTYIIHRPKR